MLADFSVLLVLFCFNFVLLRYARNPSNTFHLCIAFLPFFLTLPVGVGVHSLIFLILGIFYLVIKMYASEFFQKYEWLATSTLAIFMYWGMYTLLSHVTSMFTIFLVIELIFLFSLILVIGNKGFDSLEMYFIPNLLLGLGVGICMLCFMYASHDFTIEMLYEYYHIVYTEKPAFILHLILMLFIYFLSFKMYVFPGNHLVPFLYQSLTTAQVAVFSTLFTLPYMHLASILFSTLPIGYKFVLFFLMTWAVLWCLPNLVKDRRIKVLMGVLTVFTQNVMLFILISGPSGFNQHYIYVTLFFLFFYLLSVMPFLYLLSRSDSDGLIDVRLKSFLWNSFTSALFYLAWLALAGLPLTFMYVTKIATLTQIMGHLSAGFAFWTYLILSFYIYVVLFIFIFLTKEIYVLHKKDLANTTSQKDQPWVKRALGILPWVLLIVLYLLFMFIALSFY